MAVLPTAEQFEAFANGARDGEIVMINLLKFPPADGGAADGAGDEDRGAEYRRYTDKALAMVRERGGHVVWMGKPEHVVIGEPSDEWDLVVLVSYPNRAAFLDMVANPDYRQAHKHRERGLERSALIACQPLDAGS
ncbi:MAG TPA: DUF1330 domain-containing protein [Acidimicrobiales bacterium]|nr:DUF1330 domain-containing protein [Acidimicrobiales bacterium]